MSFEDKLLERLGAKENQWPYRVIQVKPNKKKDYEIYTLSGREEDIAANGSLFLALYDLQAKDKINFEEFWEEWEMGFPKLTERIETNYPTTSWRKPDSRPRYREWKDPSPGATKYNYRVIEYWRDRSVEAESIILAGNDTQLIDHIIQIEYEGSSQNIASVNGKNSKPPLKGWPAITLNFIQPNEEVRRKLNGSPRTRVTGEKTIRCVNFTDDRRIVDLGLGAELIKTSNIRQWATRIQEQFSSPAYRWQKGRECLSYSGHIARLQGLEGYAFVRSAQQGKDLFTRLLKIFDFTPDRLGFRYSGNEAAEEAYPADPPDFQLLGKEWEAEAERAIAEVVFDNASLYLPKLRAPIPLIKGSKIVYEA
jgi:hypothetical protein